MSSQGTAILLFFLSCIAIAGNFSGITINKRIVFVQALPSLLALLLLVLN